MKRKFLFSVTCALMAGQVTFAAELSAVKKDIEIMSRIFEAAYETENAGKSFFEHDRAEIDGTYLAGQGIVFTISPRGSHYITHLEAVAHELPTVMNEVWENLNESFGNEWVAAAPMPPEPVIPPMPDAFFESGEGQAKTQQMRKEFRELKDQQRALQRELRDYQRQLQARDSNSSREQLEQQKEKLDQVMEKLKSAQSSYQKKLQSYQNEQKNRYQEKIRKMEDSTLSTLCDYSVSLKGLDRNEKVTLIFKDVVIGDKATDNIYIFEKEQLMDCSKGSTSLAELKKEAINYQF